MPTCRSRCAALCPSHPPAPCSYESVNRASKTAAPLFKWVVSQVLYAEILERVQPLRNEVAELQEQSDTLSEQYEQQTRLTAELEASIAR